jgi:hypothetical protein
MNKRIRALILSAIIILAGVVTTSAQKGIVDSMDFQDQGITLTLDQAMQVMLKDNPTLQQSNIKVDQARLTAEKLQNSIRDLSRNTNYNTDGSLTSNQGKYYQLTADFGVAQAQRNLDAATLTLKANILQYYYGVLQAQQVVDINKASLDLANDLNSKVQKKYDLGLVAKKDVLSSEQTVITAQNTYNASQNDLKNQKMQLNVALGYDVMADVKLKDQLNYKEFKVDSIAKDISDALTNRNEIKGYQYANDAQKLNLAIAHNYYEDWQLQYKIQAATTNSAQKDLDNNMKSIEVEVRSNYLDMLNKYDLIKANEKSVEVATETLKINQVTYDTGMGLLTDVQKSQTDLQNAQVALSKSILAYNMAVSKFVDSTSVGRNANATVVTMFTAP